MAVSTPTQRRYSSAVFAIFSAHKNTCRSANIVFNTGLQNFVSLRVSRMSWHKQDRSKKNPWGFEKQTPVKKKHGRVNTCDRSLKAKPIIKRAAVVAHWLWVKDGLQILTKQLHNIVLSIFITKSKIYSTLLTLFGDSGDLVSFRIIVFRRILPEDELSMIWR